MTRKQRTLVASWALGGAVLAAAVLFSDWLLAHWDLLRWPVFALIVLLAVTRDRSVWDRQGREATLTALAHSPWAMGYWLVYCIAAAAGIYYVLSNNVDVLEVLGIGALFGIFILLVLPIVIIQMRTAFRLAGREDEAR